MRQLKRKRIKSSEQSAVVLPGTAFRRKWVFILLILFLHGPADSLHADAPHRQSVTGKCMDRPDSGGTEGRKYAIMDREARKGLQIRSAAGWPALDEEERT